MHEVVETSLREICRYQQNVLQHYYVSSNLILFYKGRPFSSKSGGIHFLGGGEEGVCIPVMSLSCLASKSMQEMRFSPGLTSLSVNT